MKNLVRGLSLAAGAVAAVALAAAATRAETPADKKAAKGEPVKKVVSVEYKLEVTEPPSLIVTAVGQVPTGGWTGAKLTHRTYVKPPADGIYEYDLTAVRPTGFVTQVISTVTAKDEWKDPPKGMKGIKVYGVGDGAKTVKFDEKKKK